MMIMMPGQHDPGQEEDNVSSAEISSIPYCSQKLNFFFHFTKQRLKCVFCVGLCLTIREE